MIERWRLRWHTRQREGIPTYTFRLCIYVSIPEACATLYPVGVTLRFGRMLGAWHGIIIHHHVQVAMQTISRTQDAIAKYLLLYFNCERRTNMLAKYAVVVVSAAWRRRCRSWDINADMQLAYVSIELPANPGRFPKASVHGRIPSEGLTSSYSSPPECILLCCFISPSDPRGESTIFLTATLEFRADDIEWILRRTAREYERSRRRLRVPCARSFMAKARCPTLRAQHRLHSWRAPFPLRESLPHPPN